MAKLKEGEKVVQLFNIGIKFKAADGDTKYKAGDIKEVILDDCCSEYGQDHGVKVVVKEVKTPVL